MTPNEIAGLAGAFIAGGVGVSVLFVKHVMPWVHKRDNDVAEIKKEVGVGEGNDTMSELVISTSAAVRRIEDDGARAWNGIGEILRVQEGHGVRLTKMEEKYEVLNDSVEKFHAAFTAHDLAETDDRRQAAEKAVR